MFTNNKDYVQKKVKKYLGDEYTKVLMRHASFKGEIL